VNRVRLISDPPARGTWNMAVDDVLLASAAAGITTLRFYQWSEPTLSLGYFQAAAERVQHAASRNCPLVRRASGGGAIVHDRELTYSFAVPQDQRFGTQAAALYDLFHDSLLGTLADFGVPATRCAARGHAPEQASGRQEFLCFQRHTRGDVLAAGHKIAGSAQRRQRGGLLQHGSILLGASPGAPELPGIAEIAGVPVGAGQLAAGWAARLARDVKWTLAVASLDAAERHEAAAREADRFAAESWTYRR
jgi:lipoate-protein ligase A